MARQKRKTLQRSVGVVALLLVLGVAYVYSNCPTYGEQLANKVADVSREQSFFTTETSDTAEQKRAYGMEIPAYLTDRPEEIVQHTDFILSYNNKHLVPNWVAWVLTPSRNNGSEKRANNFHPDTSIKHGPIALDSDYRHSGYDRGHMCPSADNKHTREAMNECFLLSNICPQVHALNAGDWERLETLCRRWAATYDSIYIVCGPIIDSGETYETIGANKVMVPKQFYKVVFRWTGEDSGEAIGFIFNNDEVRRPLTTYVVSVDSVETRTGINFFSKVPQAVQQEAETHYDCAQWQDLEN